MSEIGRSGMQADREEAVQRAVEVAIRIGVIAVLLLWVFQIVAPFVSAILWGAIIAVAGRGPYHWLEKVLGGRRVAAAVVFTVLALVLLIIPAFVLTGALVEWARGFASGIGEGQLAVPPAPDAVRGWPLVGEPLYEFWSLANANLAAALEKAREPLQGLGVWLLSAAASAGFGVLQFALSIVVAGALLANSEGAKGVVDRFAMRLAPERGPHMRELAEQTVRGVASGVVGVALIQCVLAAIGFFAIGVPGAAFIALACLLLGMMQLPLAIPILPVVVYVWMHHEWLPAALFTAYIVPVMMLDNVLKPILMGRGVDAPMLVVFIGAIGGFASSGIVGLFLGAVVMVVAYELVKAWLEPAPPARTGPPTP
jgi:predicted PurR-regulated permease PerM